MLLKSNIYIQFPISFEKIQSPKLIPQAVSSSHTDYLLRDRTQGYGELSG